MYFFIFIGFNKCIVVTRRSTPQIETEAFLSHAKTTS